MIKNLSILLLAKSQLSWIGVHRDSIRENGAPWYIEIARTGDLLAGQLYRGGDCGKRVSEDDQTKKDAGSHEQGQWTIINLTKEAS